MAHTADQFPGYLETMFSTYMGHTLRVAHAPALAELPGDRPIPVYETPPEYERVISRQPDTTGEAHVLAGRIQAMCQPTQTDSDGRPPSKKRSNKKREAKKAGKTMDELEQTLVRDAKAGRNLDAHGELLDIRRQLGELIMGKMPATERAQFPDDTELRNIMLRLHIQTLIDLADGSDDVGEGGRICIQGSDDVNDTRMRLLAELDASAWYEYPNDNSLVFAVRIEMPEAPDLDYFMRTTEFIVRHYFAPRLIDTRFDQEPCLEYAYARDQIRRVTLFVHWAPEGEVRARRRAVIDADANTSNDDQMPHDAAIFMSADRLPT